LRRRIGDRILARRLGVVATAIDQSTSAATSLELIHAGTIKCRLVGALLMGLVFFLPTAWAQKSAATQTDQSHNVSLKDPGSNSSTKPDESLPAFRTAVREVHLVFTVTDKHGHYIKDLHEDDVNILDDDRPPQEILSFHSETNLPLRIGLLIDTSQSVRDRFKFEQQAAINFLNETLRQKYDQAFVMGFDIAPQVTQDFTDDIEKLAVGINTLRPRSLTAMYDAVYYACHDKLTMTPQAGPVRRVIILVSDGNDNASSVTQRRAIEIVQQTEVSVYTVSTSLTRSKARGRKNLETLADTTGGRSYVPIHLGEVTTAFASIQEELRSQYEVSYKPAAFRLDGHYRTIKIQAKGQKGLRIRSRKGYRSQ